MKTTARYSPLFLSFSPSSFTVTEPLSPSSRTSPRSRASPAFRIYFHENKSYQLLLLANLLPFHVPFSHVYDSETRMLLPDCIWRASRRDAFFCGSRESRTAYILYRMFVSFSLRLRGWGILLILQFSFWNMFTVLLFVQFVSQDFIPIYLQDFIDCFLQLSPTIFILHKDPRSNKMQYYF